MPFAVIFPGQGAATPGLGHSWIDHPAWQVVADAEAATGQKLARLLLDADADELGTTRASQLVVLLSSLIAWQTIQDACSAYTPGAVPVAYAGHSLGQITALIAAGALTPSDGYRLAVARAEASQASADRRQGRMVALVGATPAQAEQACAAGTEVWVANENAPGQVVIAGSVEGVEAAVAVAVDLGVRRTIALGVGHAFHTPLLEDAAAELHPVLAGTAFADTSVPVVANTDAAPHTLASDWPAQLGRHLVEPVRWIDSQHALAGLGATTFIEVGPGRTLAGMARRTVPDIEVVNIATPDDLPGVVKRLTTRLEQVS